MHGGKRKAIYVYLLDPGGVCCYLDEVVEHEPLREATRAMVGEQQQQPPHPLWGPRQDDVLDRLGVTTAEQGAVVSVSLEQVGAGDRHPLHCTRAQ